MSFAQTHKLVGDYVSAWSIFEELEEEDLTDLFHYERLFRDIALDLSNDTNITLLNKLCNCFDYLEYVYTQADLDANGFTISETYVELGKMFLDHCQNCEKAILCFNRDLQIRRISDPDESLGFGPVYERLADAYAFFDTEKALENYEKAIDQYSLLGALSIIDMALCLCKLGELRSEHQVEPFNRALTLILSIDDQQFQLNRDEISSCLLHLAKSCSRCESLVELALEICQTAFRLYPYDPESKPGINNDFEQCIDLLLTLYEKKKSESDIV
jgi:tetratricopeptide (TPR) repeat protein